MTTRRVVLHELLGARRAIEFVRLEDRDEQLLVAERITRNRLDLACGLSTVVARLEPEFHRARIFEPSQMLAHSKECSS